MACEKKYKILVYSKCGPDPYTYDDVDAPIATTLLTQLMSGQDAYYTYTIDDPEFPGTETVVFHFDSIDRIEFSYTCEEIDPPADATCPEQ